MSFRRCLSNWFAWCCKMTLYRSLQQKRYNKWLFFSLHSPDFHCNITQLHNCLQVTYPCISPNKLYECCSPTHHTQSRKTLLSAEIQQNCDFNKRTGWFRRHGRHWFAWCSRCPCSSRTKWCCIAHCNESNATRNFRLTHRFSLEHRSFMYTMFYNWCLPTFC